MHSQGPVDKKSLERVKELETLLKKSPCPVQREQVKVKLAEARKELNR